MAHIKQVQPLIEAARAQRQREEAETITREIAAMEGWAARVFSSQLRGALGWHVTWDSKAQVPYLAFSIEQDAGDSASFRVDQMQEGRSSDSRGHHRAVLKQITPTQRTAEFDTEHELLLALGAWLEPVS